MGDQSNASSSSDQQQSGFVVYRYEPPFLSSPGLVDEGRLLSERMWYRSVSEYFLSK